MTRKLSLRLLFVFSGYLVAATVVFGLLSRFSSPASMPKLAMVITNGTVFILPLAGYFFVLRRAEALQERPFVLFGCCVGLTLASCVGLMFWFFLLTFGAGAFT